MYNEKICQRLRAKIDSSLFPDQKNGKYVSSGPPVLKIEFGPPHTNFGSVWSP